MMFGTARFATEISMRFMRLIRSEGRFGQGVTHTGWREARRGDGSVLRKGHSAGGRGGGGR